MLRKEYDELWAKISETEVEKWAKLVDAECTLLLLFTGPWFWLTTRK